MIYHVYANRSNIGDWVSAKGIQQLLSPHEIIECFCDEPFVPKTMQHLSKAGGKDLIIIGGGGLLMDYFLPFWKSFDAIADVVPFCLWGLGYCDLKHTPSLMPKELIQQIIHKSKLTIVRDELSRSYIDDAALPAPVPCPSINFIKPVNQGKGVMHIVNYESAGADVYQTMHDTAKRFAEDSSRTFYETNHRIPNHSEAHMAAILNRYQQSDVVISSALHGCIIGVAMGLKVIAVSGDRKIDAFMHAVGLQEWVLDLSEISLLSQKLQRLGTQTSPSALLDNIRNNNQQVARRIKDLYEALSKTGHASRLQL